MAYLLDHQRAFIISTWQDPVLKIWLTRDTSGSTPSRTRGLVCLIALCKLSHARDESIPQRRATSRKNAESTPRQPLLNSEWVRLVAF